MKNSGMTLNRLTWLIPIIFFLGSLFDETISNHLKMPAGVITTILEILLAGIIVFEIGRSSIQLKYRYFLIPAFIATGDFFYCLFNYVLKAPIPNHMGCLIYVTPYLLALALIIHALIGLTKSAEETQPEIMKVAIFISFLVLAITTYDITIPALFYKSPALIPLMQVLTVIYSLLESIVIGFSIALLLCANSRSLQLLLFGILVMHVSDMAIRYQSVNVELMGMNIFDNGWCLGLSFAAIASRLFNKQMTKDASRAIWLPLRSIRGMTIVFILIGFAGLWLSLSYYYHQLAHIAPVASTLLISIGSFAFAIIVADFVTNHITEIVLKIQNKNEFKLAMNSPFVPHEIRVIASHFDKLNQEIAAEKDRVLTLTSTVTHDLRNPLTAIQSILPLLENMIGDECGCKESAEPYINNLKTSTRYMKKISDDLLKDRKAVLQGEWVKDALQEAKQMAEFSQHQKGQKNKITLETEGVIPGLRIDGLTRVLSNLIHNAVDASPAGEEVKVSVKDGTNGVEITVIDRGMGIREDVLRTIQSGESITTKENGNGLGLPYMVSWAKKQGVDYEINSTLGKGTEITLRLNQHDEHD